LTLADHQHLSAGLPRTQRGAKRGKATADDEHVGGKTGETVGTRHLSWAFLASGSGCHRQQR
jgi:hypothetical protein